MGNKAKETHPNPQGKAGEGHHVACSSKGKLCELHSTTNRGHNEPHLSPVRHPIYSHHCLPLITHPQAPGVPFSPSQHPGINTTPSSPPSHFFLLRNTFPCHSASLVFPVKQKLYSAKRHFFIIISFCCY